MKIEKKDIRDIDIILNGAAYSKFKGKWDSNKKKLSEIDVNGNKESLLEFFDYDTIM